MRLSQHAQIRIQQRGIDAALVDHIVANGRTFRAPGGATLHLITKRQIRRSTQALLREKRRHGAIESKAIDHERRCWEDAAGVAVIMEGHSVLTVEHRDRRILR